MARIVEQLAELTGYKDRDIMDVTLVTALRDLLLPLSVSIHRVVGQDDNPRWLTRARVSQGDAVPQADALSGDLDALPALDQYPARKACLERRELRESVSGSEFIRHFPLVSDHDGDGVLEIVTRTRLSAVDQHTVSAVIRIYHNFQGLLDYSERDTLTGLLNRKTFDESFLKLQANQPLIATVTPAGDRRQEGPPSYWLGVVDIDHFKRVNDGFGHLIGDEVLLLLSRLMRTCFRFHDRLYRFGGEEFVVLLRCESEEAAQMAFERLRQNCARYPFPQVGTVTLSIGFTRVLPHDSPSACFERADKAVYAAKGAGRDRVYNHESLVIQGVLQETRRDSDVELF